MTMVHQGQAAAPARARASAGGWLHPGTRSRFLAAFAGLFVLFLLKGDFTRRDASRPRIGEVDACFYFGIANSLLFDRDFDLSNQFQRYAPVDNEWSRIRPETGKPGSPYAIGYSVLSTPFLAAGSAIDSVSGNFQAGYGPWAVFFFFLANVVFTAAGTAFLVHFLIEATPLGGRDSRQARLLVFIAALGVLGTTAFYYAFSPMAHAGSFCLSALFLCVWWRVKDSLRIPYWFGFGFLGGLLSITRWQDVFLACAPVLHAVASRFLPGGNTRHAIHAANWIAYGAGTLLCWIPQLVEWHTIYGSWLTIPQGEGFLAWPPTHFFPALFSSRCGWFIWTPLTLLGVVGLVAGGVRRPALFLPWVVAIMLEVTLIGCQPTNWHGKDSFSIRSLTSTIPLVAWGLATLVAQSRKAARAALLAAAVVCTLWSMAFVLQKGLHSLPGNERLTLSEMFSEKFHPIAMYRRTADVKRAAALEAAGTADPALALLRSSRERWGENRLLLRALSGVCKRRNCLDSAEIQQRLLAEEHRVVW